MFPTKDQVRQITFRQGWCWSLAFDPSPPAPFNKIFPATSISENICNLENYPIDIGITSLRIPNKKEARVININYLDDENNTLSNWIKDWEDFITKDNRVAYLLDSIRMITIYKYKTDLQSGVKSCFKVTPEGSLLWAGSSQSGESPENDITFIIQQVVYENEPI